MASNFEFRPATVTAGTRLHREYLNGAPQARRWFAGEPDRLESYAKRAALLDHNRYDRTRLCDELTDYNRAIGNDSTAFENIERLRQPNSVAVLTGQQAGLFTGPIYTLYKALTAIKLAQVLSNTLAPRPVVPVFWIAADDHDLGEINHTSLPVREEGSTRPHRIRIPLTTDGRAARDAPLSPEDWNRAIADLRRLLPNEGQTVATILAIATEPATPVDQFAKMLARLLGRFGLIVCEPSRLEPLYRPMVESLLAKSQQVESILRETATALTDSGYNQPVAIEENFTGLFATDQGRRVKILRVAGSQGKGGTRFAIKTKSDEGELIFDSPKELLTKLKKGVSGNVLIRPLLQDVVFPNIAFIAGPSEVCYFAQLRRLYEQLSITMPAIVPRFSATVVDARSRRLMAKFGALAMANDPLSLPKEMPGQGRSADTAERIGQVAQQAMIELRQVAKEVAQIDLTQEKPFGKSLDRMESELAKLARRAADATNNAAGIGRRQWESVLGFLQPNGRLQERVYNGSYFIEQQGEQFLDEIYNGIEPLKFGHRLVITD